MNFKTTLALVVFVVAGGVLFWLGPEVSRRLGLVPEPMDGAGAGTAAVLAEDFTPAKLTRIEVKRGDRHVALEGGAGREWALPGRWPVRQEEAQSVVDLLTHLSSRFVPMPVAGADDLKRYGLDPAQHPVEVVVRAGDAEHRLLFGEAGEPDGSDPFTRPTYLRLDDKPEVLRLAPGLLAALKSSPDDYQKRRLFPDFSQAKIKTLEMPDFSNPSMPQEPRERDKLVELFDNEELTVQAPQGTYTLKRVSQGNKSSDTARVGTSLSSEEIARGWEIVQPVHDHLDDKKLESILIAVPDIWAERFVDSSAKPGDAASYGLAKPEATIRVRKANGDTRTLLIGNPTTPASSPPPPDPVSPAVPREEKFRYAKLEGNDQIFQIKSGKFEEGLFVSLKDLRDARVARFRTEDVRRVTLKRHSEEIALAKENEQWRLQKPVAASAEFGKVSELLDKLARLEARGDDVSDRADPKFGLDKPAVTIAVELEESQAGTKQSRTMTFALVKHDAAKNKVFIKLEGWQRVNFVEDGVLKLADRPALAYRGRNVLDFTSDALAKLELEHGAEKFALEQKDGKWREASPVQTDADHGKVNQLAGDLGRLEAVEFVNENPKADELEKLYGLGKPSIRATMRFSQADKPAKSLLLGKQRPDKPEYYARIVAADGNTGTGAGPVFVVKDDIHRSLEQSALAYLPLELWRSTDQEIAGLTIRKDGNSYRLRRDGAAWQIAEPFTAPALAETVQTMTKELANPRGERYVAFAPKDLKAYGLDKPSLAVTVESTTKPSGASPQSLLIGAPTSAGAKTRFAKLANSPGVLVVGEALVTAVDHHALELLDRHLLSLDAGAITRIQSKRRAEALVLNRDGSGWRAESNGTSLAADQPTVDGLLKALSHLEALRYAAYGAKADAAAHGLDKPAQLVTITVHAGAGDGKAKTVEHRLALGKNAAQGERFARLDDGPGVFVLGGDTVAELEHGLLDFADRRMTSLEPAKVVSVACQSGGQEIQVDRRDDGWQLVKPAASKADDAMLDHLVAELCQLRAERVAAYQAKNLKPFGLDPPEAVVTLKMSPNAKEAPRILKLGKPVDGANKTVAKPPDRFAQLDGSPIVGVVSGALCQKLLAGPLQFRDRMVAQFTDADRIVLERGPRRAVFAKVEGSWKMTKPLAGEAEQTELEDFVNAVARLKADELVTEKASDVKPYGLDKPAVHWQFYDGEKQVLNLLVGSGQPAKSGEGRCYAKLASGNLVFLLDGKTTAKVLGEYRSRSLWSGLDAAQIETVRYSYAAVPFTLHKSGGSWEVLEKPTGKVKSEAVTEALDALSRLRAERFVADKDADLKLYGLQPPELALNVQAPSGNHVLHVGRLEGGSQRYYARIPEGNRSDVFVIGAADAQKIIRRLDAFLQQSGAPARPGNAK